MEINNASKKEERIESRMHATIHGDDDDDLRADGSGTEVEEEDIMTHG